MNKAALRALYKSKREALSESDVHSLSLKISALFQQNIKVNQKLVHLFSSIASFKEVDTSSIKSFLFENKATIATSIMHYAPFSLSHSIIETATEYELDAYNIPTPKTIIPVEEQVIDIVLIPLLAYDNNGNRVGYGKGIYDSFLSKCSSSCLKIGVSFYPPVDEINDVHKGDVQLDYCITPEMVYSFNETK